MQVRRTGAGVHDMCPSWLCCSISYAVDVCHACLDHYVQILGQVLLGYVVHSAELTPATEGHLNAAAQPMPAQKTSKLKAGQG